MQYKHRYTPALMVPLLLRRIELRKLKKKGLSNENIKLFLKLLDYLGEF